MENKQILDYFLDNKYFLNKELMEVSNYWGEKMFELETSHGFPMEICVDELKKNNYSNDMIAVVIMVYQTLKIKHNLGSGMYEDKVTKIQQNNIRVIKLFIDNGEI